MRIAFGEALQRRRTLAGFSQRSFAQASGVSNSHLRKIEAGETSPSLVTVYKFAVVLEVSTNELILEMDDRMRTHRNNDRPPA